MIIDLIDESDGIVMSERQMKQNSQNAQQTNDEHTGLSDDSTANSWGVEPEDESFVLVNGDAVWARNDLAAAEDPANALERWWLLDGGIWSERPMTWEMLCRNSRVIMQLEVVDLIYQRR